jgi:hypothetical protein
VSERVPVGERAQADEPVAGTDGARAESETAPEDSHISDSVSGLLRLRKQAGR